MKNLIPLSFAVLFLQSSALISHNTRKMDRSFPHLSTLKSKPFVLFLSVDDNKLASADDNKLASVLVTKTQDKLCNLKADLERKKKEVLVTDLAVKQLELYIQFMTVDKDGSGDIDVSELREALQAMGKNPTDEELIAIIRDVDENKSGSVDFDEFVKFMGKNGQKISTDTGHHAFATYDWYTSKSTGVEVTSTTASGEAVPSSAIVLCLSNFLKELKGLLEWLNSISFFRDNIDHENNEFRRKLKLLQLSNDAIWAREAARQEVKAPWVIKAPYFILCFLLDKLFDGKPISRFYFLETVARMPYFSYITMLHSYETLGWWRRSTEAKRVHFAEEYNEYHHLLIMEALGGDQEWIVRFLSQHSAIVYFFVLIGLWITSPSLAYNFSELIEAHAVDTYAEFAEANKEILQSLPPPPVAKSYYEAADMYVFDEFQTNRKKGSRRPVISNLYDVFCSIRDDEAEHVATMAACQDPVVLVRSPNSEAAIAAAALAGVLVSQILVGGDVSEVMSTIEEFGGSAMGEVVDAVYDGDLTESAELVGDGVIFAQIIAAVAKFLPFLF